MGIKIDLINKVFGRLLVIEEAGRDKYRNILWKCQCDCGNIVIACGDSLRRRRKQSCGCLEIESRITHGGTHLLSYRVWNNMIRRCTYERHASYENYGGRGITVCKRWLRFENFLEDMGERPKGLTIERKNNNGNYEKENCIWASQAVQMKNQRMRKDNKSGAKGVWWNKKRQKYSVTLGVNKKSLFLGYFIKLSEAKATRQRAEQKYWRGE